MSNGEPHTAAVSIRSPDTRNVRDETVTHAALPVNSCRLTENCAVGAQQRGTLVQAHPESGSIRPLGTTAPGDDTKRPLLSRALTRAITRKPPKTGVKGPTLKVLSRCSHLLSLAGRLYESPG
jgi:hypothetical protein